MTTITEENQGLPSPKYDMITGYTIFINHSRQVTENESWVGADIDTTHYKAIVFRVGIVSSDTDEEQTKNIRDFHENHFFICDDDRDAFEKYILELSKQDRVIIPWTLKDPKVKVVWFAEKRINPIQ